jgi:Nif-specific regulatory protein
MKDPAPAVRPGPTKESHRLPTTGPHITAISGPLEGQVFDLREGEISIGRHSSNAIQLAEISVSRRHCVLRPEDDGVWLEDCGSENGTYLNGRPVERRLLERGDLLTVGDFSFLYSTGKRAASVGPAGLRLSNGEFDGESTFRLDRADGFYGQPKQVLARLPVGERIARSLNALLRVAASLNRLQSVETLGGELLDHLLEVIPADNAALLMTVRGTDEVESVVTLQREPSQEPVELSRRVLRQTLSEATPLLHKHVDGARSGSLISVPLIATREPFGVLYLDCRSPEVEFDEEHLELAIAVAEMGAAALRAAQHLAWLTDENERLRQGRLQHEMVGESPAMLRVLKLLERVAPADTTLLLLGESGTGKELAARAVHRSSPRAGKPMVTINCAALSEQLLESELFGHEKGAFTGAVGRKVGKFELADGGTIFLDEVAELPADLQAKLLRAIEQKEFDRVGGLRPIRVDTRIIAATNRDLRKRVEEGEFREDLYYRLNVIHCEMPPLRERGADACLLADHFTRVYRTKLGRGPARVSRQARSAMALYDWPGNVRELANAIERAVVMGDGDEIRVEDLPEAIVESGARGEGNASGYQAAVKRLKRELILKAVRDASGNVTQAARVLDLNPTYLFRLLRTLDLREELE